MGLRISGADRGGQQNTPLFERSAVPLPRIGIMGGKGLAPIFVINCLPRNPSAAVEDGAECGTGHLQVPGRLVDVGLFTAEDQPEHMTEAVSILGLMRCRPALGGQQTVTLFESGAVPLPRIGIMGGEGLAPIFVINCLP